MAGSGSVARPVVPASTMNSAGPSSSIAAPTTNSSPSAARAERLDAVEREALGGPRGGGLEVEGIEQRARLEQRERRHGRLVADERRQVARLLAGVAEQRDRGRDRRRSERCERQAGIAVGEALGDEDGRDSGALGHRAAELLGHAEHRGAELRALAQQLRRRGAGGVGLLGGRTQPLRGEVGEDLLQHLLLVVRREVEELRLGRRRLARGTGELGGRAERPARGGRGAEAALGALVDELLNRLAQAGAVEQVEPRKSVEGLEAEAHAAVGEAHVDPLSSGSVNGWRAPSRCGLSASRSRTAKRISLPSSTLANVTVPGSRIGLRKRTSTA
jgi:hypothetical protein